MVWTRSEACCGISPPLSERANRAPRRACRTSRDVERPHSDFADGHARARIQPREFSARIAGKKSWEMKMSWRSAARCGSVQQYDGAVGDVEGGRFARSRRPDFRNGIIVDLLIDQAPFEFAAGFAFAGRGDAVLQIDGHPIAVGERNSGYERHLHCTSL